MQTLLKSSLGVGNISSPYPQAALYKEFKMRKKFIMIKRLLKSTILGQFYLIWAAPVDGEATKSIEDQEVVIKPHQNFTEHVFRNIVIAQKGGNRL